jgi:hypothetical protein
MTDLAARVEAATPDQFRELEAEIDQLLGWQRLENPTSAGGLIDMWNRPDGTIGRRDELLHRYLTSLDAAMTLATTDEMAFNSVGHALIRVSGVTDNVREALPRFVTAASLRAIEGMK